LVRPIEDGGWGIIDPGNFSKSLIIKNMWREMTGTDLWFIIVREKYMCGHSLSTWIRNGARRKESMSAIA